MRRLQSSSCPISFSVVVEFSRFLHVLFIVVFLLFFLRVYFKYFFLLCFHVKPLVRYLHKIHVLNPVFLSESKRAFIRDFKHVFKQVWRVYLAVSVVSQKRNTHGVVHGAVKVFFYEFTKLLFTAELNLGSILLFIQGLILRAKQLEIVEERRKDEINGLNLILGNSVCRG